MKLLSQLLVEPSGQPEPAQNMGYSQDCTVGGDETCHVTGHVTHLFKIQRPIPPSHWAQTS